MDVGVVRPAVNLPDFDSLTRLVNLLLEIELENKQRLTRLETRMCRMMAAQGIDLEGKKL